jgi:hypothetical protein
MGVKDFLSSNLCGKHRCGFNQRSPVPQVHLAVFVMHQGNKLFVQYPVFLYLVTASPKVYSQSSEVSCA